MKKKSKTEKNLFDDEIVSGRATAIASEKSLARNWLTPEEDKAWQHLQGKKTRKKP